MSCHCGCGTCETIRGPLLTDGKVKVKSLVTPNPKWTGWIAYKNKKDKYVKHNILNGKRT